MNKKRFSTQDISFCGLGAIILTVCSWICIPSPIPFTMQTFAIVAVSLFLGKKCASLAVLVYILLGIVGIPVFAGFKTGVTALSGPTGGYILGLLFLPIIICSISAIKPESFTLSLLSALCGIVFLYTFGTIWYLLFITNSPDGFFAVASVCVFPFVVPDVLKCILAVICVKKLKRILCIH